MQDRETALSVDATYLSPSGRIVRVQGHRLTGRIIVDSRGRVAVRNIDTDRLSYVHQADLREVASPLSAPPQAEQGEPSVIGAGCYRRVQRDDELIRFALSSAVNTLEESGCACQPEELCALCLCKEAVIHMLESQPASALPQEPTGASPQASNLHAQIMNLPYPEPLTDTERRFYQGYKLGFRDARHAAAELVAGLPVPVSPVEPTPEPETCEQKYNELLYAVVRKYPGESRHETALRYIREKETAEACGPKSSVPSDETPR